MAYATRDDVIASYERAVIDRVCWDNNTKSANYARLDAGLESASTEIDSYVSARFPVPVTPTPAILRTINIDLGIYYTALTADKLFDELRMRADNWRRHLVLIAKGQAGLGIHQSDTSDPTLTAEGSSTATGMFARSERV